MIQQNRIDQVYKLSDDVIIVVCHPVTGHYWKKDNNGYDPYIEDARKFTRKDIINMLQDNQLRDKEIKVFTHIQTI